jgi:hypothetical protein
MIGREKSLNQVAQAGYSYGYVSYIDTTTGKKFFLVDAEAVEKVKICCFS